MHTQAAQLSVPVGSAARTVVSRLRSRWRRRVLLDAALLSCATLVGGAVLLVLIDQIGSLPSSMRAPLRFMPFFAAFAVLLTAVRRVLPGPSPATFALLAEERDPALAGYVSTALHLEAAAAATSRLTTAPPASPAAASPIAVSPAGESVATGPVLRAFHARAADVLAGAAPERLLPQRSRAPLLGLGASILAAVLVVAFTPARSSELWQRWVALTPGPSASILAGMPGETAATAVAVASLDDLRVRVVPPRYTGHPPRDASASEMLAALAGSVIEVSGRVPAGAAHVDARVIVEGDDVASIRALPITSERGRWSGRWTLAHGQRGLDLTARAAATSPVAARRLLAFSVLPDREPQVELRAPTEDVVVARASGIIPIAATATDDHDVADLRLTWILSRGSGESFTFTEGEWPWSRTTRGSDALTGEHDLDLAAAGLQPGDVLHVRAVARDRNDVTGPGLGVSSTRLIRIARDDEMAEVTTLTGFPLEAEREPILSQRMIILLTERLIERAPSLRRDALLHEAEDIAREQARLREHVADVIYSRQSGEHETHADHESEGRREPITARDSAQRVAELLEAASRATGRGTLEELGHDHDSDPSVAVNRTLMAAFNAMYDAELELRVGEPAAALPHEYRALEVLQSVREAERVFLRGRQSVAPVDVAAARGTGKLEDALPSARTPGRAAPDAAGHSAEIASLAERLPALRPREAALSLATLAAVLLADPAADARAGALLTRAADAAASGALANARVLALQARSLLAPAAASTDPPRVATPADAAAATYLGAIARPTTAAENGRRVAADPFVFATVRYESGDWDSAQLVPANLIHSMALYTDVPVAPDGVVVDLASPEIFRYPLLYMTGHLPVRFNARESTNLRAFVDRGGLIFIDDHNHDIDGAFHRTVTAELARIFGDDSLTELPNDHELYHAFFVFDDGPPVTGHELNGWGDGLIHEHLLAIQRTGRIGVLYSNKDYSSEWSYHVQNKRFQAIDNTRFGVNLIVYALTR